MNMSTTETPASALPGVGAGGTTDFIDPSGPGGFGSSTGPGASTPDGGPPGSQGL